MIKSIFLNNMNLYNLLLKVLARVVSFRYVYKLDIVDFNTDIQD